MHRGGGVGRGRRGSRSALTYCSTFVRRAHSSLSELRTGSERRRRRQSGRKRRGIAGVDGGERTGDEPRNPERCPALSAAAAAAEVVVVATPDNPFLCRSPLTLVRGLHRFKADSFTRVESRGHRDDASFFSPFLGPLSLSLSLCVYAFVIRRFSEGGKRKSRPEKQRLICFGDSPARTQKNKVNQSVSRYTPLCQRASLTELATVIIITIWCYYTLLNRVTRVEFVFCVICMRRLKR